MSQQNVKYKINDFEVEETYKQKHKAYTMHCFISSASLQKATQNKSESR